MFTLNGKGRLWVADRPQVMGIINITPDSFYAGSRQQFIEAILQKATQMVAEGATALDIGGQSTRPNSHLHSPKEEIERVILPIREIRQLFPDIFISIDSFYSEVAAAAVEAGADIVNDISGGMMDKDMLKVVAEAGVPFICMHMKGTPQNMQQQAVYEDVVLEVLDYFTERVTACIHAGIKDIIIDPGFGFAKTVAHNFELLQKLEVFSMLEKPLLVGVSRKSMVYKTLGSTAEQALNGTTVLNTIALMKGAAILRVHDVKEAVEAIKLTRKAASASVFAGLT